MSAASSSSSSSRTSRLHARRSRSRSPAGRPAMINSTLAPGPLLALLHLCDSLFPVGGFGYSDGLEAATAAELGATPADPQGRLGGTLDETVGRLDGPAALCAWDAFDRQDWQALCELDDETTALRPASATRRSNR